MNDPSTYNPEQIQWKEAKLHFNEVVLMGLEICRLVGYCEGDDDVYYLLKLPNNSTHHRYKAFSGVGCPMWLNRNLNQKDYDYLNEQLIWNGCPEENEFILGSPATYYYGNNANCS